MVDKGVDIEFEKYKSLFLKYKYIFCILLVVFVTSGIALYFFEIPFYTATASLTTAGTDFNVDRSNINPTLLSEVMESNDMMEAMVNDLMLMSIQIQPDLQQQAKDFIKRLLRREQKEQTLEYLVNYYKSHITLSPTRRNELFRVRVSTPDKDLSVTIANYLANELIKKNIQDRERKVNQSTAYLDEQINVLGQSLRSKRSLKVEYQSTPNYQYVVDVRTKIESDEQTLESLQREKEHLSIQDSLVFYQELDTDNEALKEQHYYEYMDQKDKNKLQQEFLDKRIKELASQINQLRIQHARMDTTEVDKVEHLDAEMDALGDLLLDLYDKKQKVVISEYVDTDMLRLFSRALPPTGPDKTKGLAYIFLFMFIGVVTNAGLLSILNFFDQRIKTADELEMLGFSFLGQVPILSKKDSRLLESGKMPHDSSFLETYKTIRTNLKFQERHSKIKTIAISSPRASTGKSFTLKNLAMVMADAGDKILIVDTDLRKPIMHARFHTQIKPGITDIIGGKATVSDAVKKIKKNLYFIPAGILKLDPHHLFESKEFKKFILSQTKKYDYVFFDSIPLLSTSEVYVLASLVDGNLFVVDKSVTKAEIGTSQKILSNVKGEVLGVVLNRAQMKNKAYKYYKY